MESATGSICEQNGRVCSVFSVKRKTGFTESEFSPLQPFSSQILSLACAAVQNSKNYCAYANERLFLPNPVGTMLHILEADLYKWWFLLFGHRRSLLGTHIILTTANV